MLTPCPVGLGYMRHASPRAIANEDEAPADKMFLDIEPGYRQYGAIATLVQGKAVQWDEKTRTVSIEKSDGSVEILKYWALILATGTRSSSPLFSLQGKEHTDVLNAQHALHKRIDSAQEIIIAGGGASGVETAGELGEYLNGPAGWFSSRPSQPKVKMTLITGSSKLLPGLRQSISDQAEIYLNRVGVDVRYNTKVVKWEELSTGKANIMLHDGEEIESDIFIPATGVRPMCVLEAQAL
jgi:apoptosis-inducing factor 2